MTPAHPASTSRARATLVWFVTVLTLGLLLFAYRHLAVLASRQSEPFLVPLVNELSAAFIIGGLFFGVRPIVRRWPITAGTWRSNLPAYLPALIAFAFLATSGMWAARTILYPMVGLGPFDYGVMPLRYLMELPLQAIGFAAMVGGIQYVEIHKAAREREVEAARLERHLAEAQLRSLRLQLQPHFLFNALNTISSEMYRDPAAADEMLAQLAELLRASLATAQSDEVTLGAELALLDRYLALMQARFGERLVVRKAIEDGTELALVPSMILQPLVENAIRHGLGSADGSGTVAVRASRLDDDRLVLEVEDDGVGARAPVEPGLGIGLSATSERLQLLYGGRQEFRAGSRPGGGFLVRAVVPFRRKVREC